MRPFYQRPLTGDEPYHINVGELGEFAAHWHGELELICARRGRLDVTVNGERCCLSERCAAVAGSAEIHAVNAVSPGAEALVVEMGYELLGSGFGAFAELEFEKSFVSFADEPALAPIEQKLEELAALAGKSDAQSALRARANLCGCAADILSLLPSRKAPERRRKHVADMLAMQQVYDYAERHYSERLTLEDAAAMSGYEKTRFCQLFSRACGTTFHRFLSERRLAASKEMLAEGDMPVCEVAERVGIPDAGVFGRMFRERFGITPTEFRADYTK